MRILHFTRDFPPSQTGGLSTAVGGLVAVLRAHGIDNATVSYDGWRPRGGSTVAPTMANGVLRVGSPAHHDAVMRFANAFHPDVVHVHDPLLWEQASGLAMPKLYTVHVAHHILRRLRGLADPTLSERGEREALRQASIVTVPTAGVAADLDHIVPRAAMRVTPFGIDAVEAAQAQATAPSRVLFAGRLSDIKGVDVLFRAMDAVISRAPEVTLRVASGLVHNRKSERRSRKRLMDGASPALRDATTWLGWLSPDALSTEQREAAIIAAPSLYETFGLGVLEAKARGRAVVATDVPGHRHQIRHDRTGILVPPNDADALAAALTTLLSEPKRRAALGSAARRDVADAHLWAHRVKAFLDAYRACASSSV